MKQEPQMWGWERETIMVEGQKAAKKCSQSQIVARERSQRQWVAWLQARRLLESGARATGSPDIVARGNDHDGGRPGGCQVSLGSAGFAGLLTALSQVISTYNMSGEGLENVFEITYDIFGGRVLVQFFKYIFYHMYYILQRILFSLITSVFLVSV